MKDSVILIAICSILILSIFLIPVCLAYSPVTNKCTGCHDGSIAECKHPHNDTVQCEQCHTTDVHRMKYIQPDGTSGNKSTAATCIDCHEAGVTGFNAPMTPEFKHSSKIDNGSIWGSYWSSERNNISCLYCHGNTKHDIIALGKIINLIDDITNERNGSINRTTWCADCHYNNSINNYYRGYLWDPVPPLTTIKNTANDRWINHTNSLISDYGDARCKSCHPINGTYPEFSSNYVHSISGVSGDSCLDCHWEAY